MSIKTDIQKLHNRLDTCQRKLDAARSRGDHEMITKFTDEVEQLTKKLNQLKHKQNYELNKNVKAYLICLSLVKSPKQNKRTSANWKNAYAA